MLGAVAMTVSAGALAQGTQPGWYAGGEIGTVDFGDEDDTGWKILGGYQLNSNFAGEVGYGSLFDKEGVEVTAFDVVGVGILPINNQFSVYGKLGFVMWEAEGPGGDADGTDLTYGIGAQYDITPKLGLRLQWQRYDLDDEEADALSVGAIYRF
jgi:OOP family OmpA-OmpF porin